MEEEKKPLPVGFKRDGTPQRRNNQFTKAKALQGQVNERDKDRIRAEMLSQRLYKYANSKGKRTEKYRMEPAQVQAAKVLIERGKPALQAIESVIYEAPASEEEIKAQLHALLSDPVARAQLESMLKHQPVALPDAPEVTQPLVSTGTSD